MKRKEKGYVNKRFYYYPSTPKVKPKPRPMIKKVKYERKPEKKSDFIINLE